MARARDVEGLDAGESFAAAAGRIVAVRAHELFDHSEGVLDTHDIERVHAMRVASRRLRAVLEIFERAFPPADWRPLLDEVKQLADALGARRDPDVQIEAFSAMAAELRPDERPGLELLLSRLRAEQAEGNRVLADALQQARERDLARRLQALAAGARA